MAQQQAIPPSRSPAAATTERLAATIGIRSAAEKRAYIAPNPTDPNIVYAGDYQGNITRFDPAQPIRLQSINVSPEISDGRGAAPLDHRFQ